VGNCHVQADTREHADRWQQYIIIISIIIMLPVEQYMETSGSSTVAATWLCQQVQQRAIKACAATYKDILSVSSVNCTWFPCHPLLQALAKADAKPATFVTNTANAVASHALSMYIRSIKNNSSVLTLHCVQVSRCQGVRKQSNQLTRIAGQVSTTTLQNYWFPNKADAAAPDRV
jgi:hypothetical protein